MRLEAALFIIFLIGFITFGLIGVFAPLPSTPQYIIPFISIGILTLIFEFMI